MKKDRITAYQRLINLQSTLHNIFLTLCGVVAVMAVVWSRDGIGVGAKTLFGFLGFILIMIWLNRRGYSMLAGFLFMGATLAILVFFTLREDGLYNIPVMGFPLLIIFGGIVLGRKIIPIVTAAIVAVVIGIAWVYQSGMRQMFDGAVPLYHVDIYTAVGVLLATGAILMILLGIIERSLDVLIESEQSLNAAYDRTLSAWAKVLEMRKREPQGHSQRLCELLVLFGDHLNLDEDVLDDMHRGILLHDIGKMGIPDAIIEKPFSLTRDEFTLVKQHPLWAARVIGSSSLLKEARNVALYHHERWDGHGYPYGLQGHEIPYAARIFTIIDHWDTLTSDQVYRQAWTKEDARGYMTGKAGQVYDPELLDSFFVALDSRGQTNAA